MNIHKHQQELPGPLGVHFELKAACEPVILLLWEQPGQNKSAIYFCLQPSCRNAFPNPIPTQPIPYFTLAELKGFIFCNVTSQDSWRNKEQGVSSGPAKEIHSAAPRSKALPLVPPILCIPELSPSPSLFTTSDCTVCSNKELLSPGQLMR